MIKTRRNIHTSNIVRKVHTAPAMDFRSITPENKRLFIAAMKAVMKAGYSGKCYAFGSRTNGTWSDGSDIDVMIDTMPRDHYEAIVDNLSDVLIQGKRIDVQMGHIKRMAEVWEISDRTVEMI